MTLIVTANILTAHKRDSEGSESFEANVQSEIFEKQKEKGAEIDLGND